MMFNLPWVATVWMPQDIGWHTVRDYSGLDRFGLDDAANDKLVLGPREIIIAALRHIEDLSA